MRNGPVKDQRARDQKLHPRVKRTFDNQSPPGEIERSSTGSKGKRTKKRDHAKRCIPPFQVIFADKQESPAWKACRQVLPFFLSGTLKEEDYLHFSNALSNRATDKLRIGVVLSIGTSFNDFWHNFISLERAGCQFFIALSVKRGLPEPWECLEPRWRVLCMQRCSSTTVQVVALVRLMQRLIRSGFSKTKPHFRPFRSLADAKELVGILPEFSHGGPIDVTNIMLAPARMLCLAQSEREWRSWLRETEEDRQSAARALSRCKDDMEMRSRLDTASPWHNALASELFDSWSSVGNWLLKKRPEIKNQDSENVRELERMMGLLTEIRSIGRGAP